ncbi:MAG TPA: c-type cytochrome [Candidatus Acidoferrum sp.]|nr:c-type cytochrome [Candidatus Acidoferrum sp.]
MVKGLIVGILVGVLLVLGAVYLYFATGRAPVAVTSPEMPFERKMARMALHAYLDKLPHPAPQAPADEKNLLDGAKVYKENCAVCHGLPGGTPTAIADGLAPRPPQLFKGTGVTDDDEWESYWKIEGGIRMTGMPGFKGRLNETQIWQVAVLVKNADKITPSVKAELAGTAAAPPPTAAVPAK